MAPDVKPGWWFPEVETKTTTELARALCASCPELGPCQRYAIAAGPMLVGVWGGLSSSERQRARRTLVTDMTDVAEVVAGNGAHVDELDVDGEDPVLAQAEAELASVRACSECAGPIGADRSADALTCGRACADARGTRKRAERQRHKANPRPQLEARRPPDKAEASADPLEVALSWFASLPSAVTGLELAGGWRLERKVV